MRAVLPGRPAASLQALCSAYWNGLRVIVYISGNALVILNGARELIQTIYVDNVANLNAVTIEETSGRIAAVGESHLHIYEPRGRDEGLLRWAQTHDLESDVGNGPINCITWGSADEILTGSSLLTLWSISENDNPRSIWQQVIARPPKLASFSHDAGLLATVGHYDRIVKLWRRLSYDADEGRFDVSYLPHPKAVANIHWRKPWHKDQNLEQLLYTFCADHKIRIWAATDPHGLSVLQLWHTIDMNEVLQPRHLGLTTSRKYALIVDGRDFAIATEKAVQSSVMDTSSDHALEHLIEIANRSPEICIVFDGQGHMSSWGLENAGGKNKTASSVFNIAHIDGLNITFTHDVSMDEDFTVLLAFSGGVSSDSFTILAHHFDGHIDWYDTKIRDLFDPSRKQHRVSHKALWSGHDGSIKKIVRNIKGNAVLSRTDENHGVVWKQLPSARGPGLTRQSTLQSAEHIHRSTILLDGSLTALLHHDGLSLWDTSQFYAQRLEQKPYEFPSKPMCVLVLPTGDTNEDSYYLAVICASGEGIVWEIRRERASSRLDKKADGGSSLIMQFCQFDLGLQENVAFVLPVDPAGSKATISGFIDLFALDVALAFSTTGKVWTLTSKVDAHNRKVDWLITCTIDTGIRNPSLASGSLIRKVALVDAKKTTLTIWDTTGGQLEYEEQFSDVEIIQDLDWASTPDNQSVLAVGFPHRVLLLSQLRYDYLNAGAAWTAVREIRIKDLTPHPIGDSCWLDNGHLVIGAGNQIFVYDQEMHMNDRLVERLRLPGRRKASKRLFEVVRRLNGPLPIFHPQFLAQCILYGKSSLVQKILITLHHKLKFWSEGDDLDSFLDLPIEIFIDEADGTSATRIKDLMLSHKTFDDDSNESSFLTEESALVLNDNLSRKTLPDLTSQEQFLLADIVECVATVEKQKRSMDENAARYMVFFRQQTLRHNSDRDDVKEVSWREIVWAFHSNSQDIIIDMISRHLSGKITWQHARRTGIFMFLADNTALKMHLETVARNEYTKNDDRSPVDCSIFYLALGKKTVLSGLWRMAQGYKEQQATMKLLANNFNEPRWKTAALKNAYALLSKRRFQYAAAFFLLGGSLVDAVNVCVHQLGDIQLAIAVARAYEGDEGPVLRNLLLDKVLPEANQSGNRWLASWAFWMLNRRDKAVRSLISPIHSLLDPESVFNVASHNIPLQAKSYLANDPALVVLYQQLRQKTLQALKGATMIDPREEWEFIVHNARLLTRMGCDLLALDLVKNFEFLKVQSTSHREARCQANNISLGPGLNGTPDPQRLLRRRSSLVVADMPSPLVGSMTNGEGLLKDFFSDDHGHTRRPKQKPPPTVFEEPSADSLLDSFGF